MPGEKNFFKKLNIFQSLQRYLHRANIQTQDDMPTDATVRTTPQTWSHSVMPSSWFWYSSEIYPAQRLRKRRYEDYSMMDDDGDIANALNIYADDSTQTDMESGRVLKVTSNNQKVIECIETLLYDTLQIDQQLWGLARDLCKYGDAPFEVVLNSSQDSIVKLVPIPVEGFVRVEKNRSLLKFLFNPAAIQLNSSTPMTEGSIIEYDPYEVAHFSLKSNEMRFYPYGRSVIESARKVWKQMKIMEDALVINRLVRAPERKVFFIEVGNMASAEAEQFVERIKANYTKNKFFNPITGEIDEKASPINQSEDFFIPVRQGSGSRIDSLPGANNLDQVNDIKLFRDKMLSAMGVPPQYMARSTEHGYESKSGLSQQDIRFGRTIMRIQKAMLAALYKICYIQLYLKGFGINDIKSLDLSMTPPNSLEEAMRLQAIRARIDVAGAAVGANLFHNEWILKNVMLLEENEIKMIMKKKQMQSSVFGDMKGGGGVKGITPTPTPSTPKAPTSPTPEAGGNVPQASPFEKFAGKSEEPEPQQGRVEVAGKEYTEDMIAESEFPKNNKYKYKECLFVNLVNDGQFDGLIDFAKADENKKQVLDEMKKHNDTVKLYDIVENLENNGGNSNEDKEPEME